MLKKVVIVSSGPIGAFGTATNLVSLSYFITRCEKGVTRRLFIFLNMFDLLVCVSEVLALAFFHCKGPDYCGNGKLPFGVAFTVLDISIETTGFATCLLGVVRVISVCLPFYQINKKALNIAKAAFIGQEIFRAILRAYFFADSLKFSFYKEFDNAVMMALLTLFILVNTISSVTLSWKLLTDVKRVGVQINQDAARKTKMRATITVLIMSGCFLFLNTLYSIALYLRIFVGKDGVNAGVYAFAAIGFWLAIPLNSALNPLIFFLRKREMRDYVKQLPRALRRSDHST